MSRPTDSERGARLAYDLACEWLAQLPLFQDADYQALRSEMSAAANAAQLELTDSRAMRRAIGQA